MRIKNGFFIGIIFIVSSSIIGWAAMFICGLMALKFGKFWAVTGIVIYALSWIPFGIGFLLAGQEGVIYAKKIFKKIFKM